MFQGQEYLAFGPLFGHQYTHVWVDFRDIQDQYMRERGIDYFLNSRRAVLAHRDYAIDNPMKWKDYSENVWGLTASDGPQTRRRNIAVSSVSFSTIAAVVLGCLSSLMTVRLHQLRWWLRSCSLRKW